MRQRNVNGRFFRIGSGKRKKRKTSILVDHNYANTSMCEAGDCCQPSCTSSYHKLTEVPAGARGDGWREGRRLIEFGVLLDNLRFCKSCRLGPVPLTCHNIVGELQKGLGGYIYVVCQNSDCNYVNRVAYGKMHRIKSRGMPCFDANTKLGTAMVDSLGGPDRVNNLLSTLNMKPICPANLKPMEERAGDTIEKLAIDSSRQAAKDAFQMEMQDISQRETNLAFKSMEGPFASDLGVCPLPGESPLSLCTDADPDADWTDVEEEGDAARTENGEEVPLLQDAMSLYTDADPDADWTDVEEECDTARTDNRGEGPFLQDVMRTPNNTWKPMMPRQCTKSRSFHRSSTRTGVRLDKKFPCITQKGMTCAVDTAWQKKGFDSLTSHTFFMSTRKYGKKVVKSIISHRTCGVCNWWRRNRPGLKVRNHTCVRNHKGSARLMESVSGEQGVVQLEKEGTPVEYIEGDGDTTLIARLRDNLNMNMKKRFDRNHVVKNVGKSLYSLHHQKDVKLSKMVIIHIEKCLKYALATNQGNVEGLRSNLKAIVPHQFGDHSHCTDAFCQSKRQPGERYIHKSLPYKAPLKDDTLREKLQHVFDPLILNASQYSDLGSSQQCEHANKEVTLRAPKSHHYGNTKSLDFRVQATAAFINEGRHYVSQLPFSQFNKQDMAHEKMGLSPGNHTLKYAAKCQKRRLEKEQSQHKLSTKRRRIILKHERATQQGAMEAIEGVSYQSGIGHSSDADVTKIPDAIHRGTFRPVQRTDGEPTFIAFDLETTDLIRGTVMPHITQIAAVETSSGEQFCTYVKPTMPIADQAQRVTGICMGDDGQMVSSGKIVDAAPIHIALDDFITWLTKFRNILLVAHNGRRFDFPVLESALLKTDNENKLKVSGYIDSLSVFKKQFPDQKNHTQENLAFELLNITYNAHNAVADVDALRSLLGLCNNETLMAHSFSQGDVHDTLLFNIQKARNIRSLDTFVCRGIMKRPTAENIAGSGLNLQHLKLIHQRSGEDGIRDVFTGRNCDGQPRVTTSKKVLEDVIPKMSKYFDHDTQE